MPAYPRMFHVARRVCEGCGAVRSLCGMFSCWFVCSRLGLLLLACWCEGVVVFVVVVGCLLFCCLPEVGVLCDTSRYSAMFSPMSFS